MCQTRTHQHSIFCFVPDFLFEAIALHGTAQQRAVALQALGTDQTIRFARATSALMAPVKRRGLAIVAVEEGHPQRTIYDAHHTTKLPGDIVRTEGSDPTGDPAVNEAYDGLGASYNFYWEVYKRNSIDDQGLPLNATVHYGQGFGNAFWDGERMVFGDGNEFFNRLTTPIDVIGHELTHGVTEHEAGLAYSYQEGALNESISDVFGSLVKQYALQQTADQADWLIGTGLFTAQVHGTALRSMKAPGTAFDDPVLGKDPQPAHMKDYVDTYRDHGGVHINSGIPNHAFYLAAIKLGGFAWEKAGRIWYETLRDPRLKNVGPTNAFRVFARLTVARAEQLYGHSSTERQAVRDAWSEVEITIP